MPGPGFLPGLYEAVDFNAVAKIAADGRAREAWK